MAEQTPTLTASREPDLTTRKEAAESSVDPLDGAPDVLRQAARGELPDGQPPAPEVEKGGVAWLLGPAVPPKYVSDVMYDTPDGLVKLKWHLRAIPGDRLLAIERANLREVDGEPGRMEVDETQAAAEVVVEATERIEDETGASTTPRDAAFRTDANGNVAADPVLALRERFKFQSGLIDQLASEVRRMGGWGPDRVGSAQRALVNAAGG